MGAVADYSAGAAVAGDGGGLISGWRETAMTIMVEVALAANTVETVLDELLVLGNRKNRRKYLELAVLASVRGLRVLSEEPFVVDPTPT
jgi:hypothetical protein